MTNQKMIDAIRTVSTVALQYSSSLVPELLPGGTLKNTTKGGEWWARNPTRSDRDAGSFSVSLADGQWHDFACGDGGCDLVSLAAYIWGVRQSEAARDLARRLGLHLEALEGCPVDPNRAEAQRKRLAATTLAAEQRTAMEAMAKRQKQEAAAIYARRLWQSGDPADPRHPYLERKRIQPHGIRQTDTELLIPLRNVTGELVNVQRVTAGGTKLFLSGGQVRSAFCLLGSINPDKWVHLCEGFATGATLFEQYGDVDSVACAMNAGNLRSVAVALRGHYGLNVGMVIAGDDDRRTDGNPGRTAANAAALASGSMLIFPEWPSDAPVELSDFNDLHCWEASNGF